MERRRCYNCIKVGVCELYDIVQYDGHAIRCGNFIDTADVVPKSKYDNLKSQFEALDHECDRLERAESNRHDAIEQAKTEVIEEYRQRVNVKMGKHTHLLGKEYVQRILREVAKEMTNLQEYKTEQDGFNDESWKEDVRRRGEKV